MDGNIPTCASSPSKVKFICSGISRTPTSGMKVLSMEENIGMEFMEKTQFGYLEPSGQMSGEIAPPMKVPPDPSENCFAFPRRIGS